MRRPSLVGLASAGATILTAHAALNLRLLRRPRSRTALPATKVSVLVPARDEATHIGPCVRAVLGSEGVDDLELLVLDDGSSDGTVDAAHAAFAGDARARLLGGKPLPDGWLGKPHACHQLAEEATGDVLVFVDADVVLEPHGLAASVDLLRRHRLDLVSPYPRQGTETLAERLVQPLLQWSWLTLLPLRIAERPWFASMTAANGQLLVCDALAYADAGGHANVRSAVLDDIALARAFKGARKRAVVADGTHLASCRMYEGWEALRAGYAKSLWSAFGSRAGAAAVVGALGFFYVLPPVAMVLGRRWRTRLLGGFGYAAGVVGRALVARETSGRVGDALAHPLSIAVFAHLVRLSWRERRRGTLTWKDRRVG